MKLILFVVIAIIITSGFGEAMKRIEKHSRHKRFKEYEEIAKSSGGFVLDVDKAEKKASELLTNMTNRNIENKIFYVENEENQSFDFNTNSLTKETYVVVNSRSNLKEIIITSPLGSKSEHLINAQEPSLFVGAINKPIAGLWKVEVKLKDQNKGYKALVAVSSTLFVTPVVYDLSLLEIDSSTKLISGVEYFIQAVFMPEISGANVTMTCLSSRRSSLCGENVLGTDDVAKFRCPNKDFHINFEGVLEGGGRFQRWISVIREVSSKIEKSEDISSFEPTVTATKLSTSFKITSKDSQEKVTFKSTDTPMTTSNSAAAQMKNIHLTFFLLILIINYI